MPGTEIGKAYVQIVPSAEGMPGAVKNILDDAGQSAGKSLGSKLVGALKAAGIGLALKTAINEGARYQQAEGGIQTLFNGYAEEMMASANDAFKIGMSANDYMEQATSFAAALKQSLGDSKLAGEAAKVAMNSMADNSAKLGTDLGMINTAYQGFAKQNYTMLDNLKLGYGGTKTEMERLIQDAAKMTKEQEKLGLTVDGNSMSFDNIINAIAVMQEHLGIAGVAADEAKSTISGSFQSMKAAASNFMAQLTMGGDIATALSNLTDTAITFVIGNLVPALGRIVAAIPSVLIQLIGTALPNVLSSISGLLDSLMSNEGTNMAMKLGSSFGKQILPALGNLIPKVLELFVKLPISLASVAASAGAGFIKQLRLKIWSGIKSLVQKIKGAFKFNISLPKVKLPHFSITPRGWKLGDLLKGTIPHLSIKWNAAGAIMKQPTIFAGGEAGDEAVVPLDPFWKKMDKMAGNIDYERLGQAVATALTAVSVNAVFEADGKTVARVSAPFMQEELDKRQMFNNRKLGRV